MWVVAYIDIHTEEERLPDLGATTLGDEIFRFRQDRRFRIWGRYRMSIEWCESDADEVCIQAIPCAKNRNIQEGKGALRCMPYVSVRASKASHGRSWTRGHAVCERRIEWGWQLRCGHRRVRFCEANVALWGERRGQSEIRSGMCNDAERHSDKLSWGRRAADRVRNGCRGRHGLRVESSERRGWESGGIGRRSRLIGKRRSVVRSLVRSQSSSIAFLQALRIARPEHPDLRFCIMLLSPNLPAAPHRILHPIYPPSFPSSPSPHPPRSTAFSPPPPHIRTNNDRHTLSTTPS